MVYYRAKPKHYLLKNRTTASASRWPFVRFISNHRISLALLAIFMAALTSTTAALLSPQQATAPSSGDQTAQHTPQVIYTYTGLSSTSTVADSFLAAAANAAQQAGQGGAGAKAKPGSPAPPPPAGSSSFPTHNNIVTTVFWVGEPATAQNGYIHNSASTWDEDWETHFGGFDDPDSRNGYLPSGFTPGENPFYFALPYSDLDDNGNRRSSAANCPESAAKQSQNTSWCKNSWIAVTKGSTTCYAQWEDAGPYGENDTAYVFGSSAPANTIDVKAGLDVSPAMRDCLGMDDVATTSWHFVAAASVPAGPWKNIITTTPSYTVD